MKKWMLYKLLGWLQRKCDHPPETVSADIASGDIENVEIKWCRICGATMIVTGGWPTGHQAWHEPRADWWIAP